MATFIRSEIDKDANIEYKHYKIDDYNYFSMIDNQVRSEYSLCEEYTLLPLVEKMYKENGLKPIPENLIHYPVEGYYYKTKGLTKFFQLIRNLQENPEVYKKIQSSNTVEDFKWLLGNNIWGTVPSLRSETLFPRMKDILTHTMNSLQYKPEWYIDNIMAMLPKYSTGVANLVELAYLTGDIRCLTAGAETNALYREMSFCLASGCGSFFAPMKIVNVYHWEVNSEVQELGERLVDSYNEILNKFCKEFTNQDSMTPSLTSKKTLGYGNENYGRSIPKLLVKPTKGNQIKLIQDLESPRVAMLGQCIDDGMYYHWILDGNKVVERWSDGMITTENYVNKDKPEQFNNWDFSGVTGEDGKINMGKLWSTTSDTFVLPKIVPGTVENKDGISIYGNPNPSKYNLGLND